MRYGDDLNGTQWTNNDDDFEEERRDKPKVVMNDRKQTSMRGDYGTTI